MEEYWQWTTLRTTLRDMDAHQVYWGELSRLHEELSGAREFRDALGWMSAGLGVGSAALWGASAIPGPHQVWTAFGGGLLGLASTALGVAAIAADARVENLKQQIDNLKFPEDKQVDKEPELHFFSDAGKWVNVGEPEFVKRGFCNGSAPGTSLK